MSARRLRPGFTLIELIVVIAIVGIIASVVGLTIKTAVPVPGADDVVVQMNAARTEAIRSRRPVSVTLHVDRVPRLMTAMPDGRIVTDVVPLERDDRVP
jgi:prepilin-type N-terminal cleavage/methylation domain-containing protein